MEQSEGLKPFVEWTLADVYAKRLNEYMFFAESVYRDMKTRLEESILNWLEMMDEPEADGSKLQSLIDGNVYGLKMLEDMMERGLFRDDGACNPQLLGIDWRAVNLNKLAWIRSQIKGHLDLYKLANKEQRKLIREDLKVWRAQEQLLERKCRDVETIKITSVQQLYQERKNKGIKDVEQSDLRATQGRV